MLHCTALHHSLQRVGGGGEFFCCEIFNIGSIDFLCWEHVGCIPVHWEKGGGARLHLILPPTSPSKGPLPPVPQLVASKKDHHLTAERLQAMVTYWQLH